MIPIKSAWRGWWQDFSSLMLPSVCTVCHLEDATVHGLCVDCAAEITAQLDTVFRAETFAEALPLSLVDAQPLPVYAASYYSPHTSAAMLGYKDHGRISLAKIFAPILTEVLEQLATDQGYPQYRLVPIPTSATGFRARGYDPVGELLGGIPPVYRLDTRLLKTRWHWKLRASHAGTRAHERRNRAADKFRIRTRPPEPVEPVVLVDDVLTTGSTLAAATRLLEAHGFDVVAAAVISAVVPPQDRGAGTDLDE